MRLTFRWSQCQAINVNRNTNGSLNGGLVKLRSGARQSSGPGVGDPLRVFREQRTSGERQQSRRAQICLNSVKSVSSALKQVEPRGREDKESNPTRTQQDQTPQEKLGGPDA